MEIQIAISSDDNYWASEEASSLRKELDFFIPQIQVQQLEKKAQPDEAPIGVMDGVLKFFLGEGFINKFLDVFSVWVKSRAQVINAKKNKIKISLTDETGSNKTIQIEGNFKDPVELIEQLKTILHN